ncbi:MAG: acyltransferase [Fibrella sp.]|nr:acyltransferase [Armatimonadota bacterium]
MITAINVISSTGEPSSVAPAGNDTVAKKDRRIPGLDGLRAISILFVLFGHGYASMGGLYAALHIPPAGVHFVGNAHLGVVVFFVISGYLITTLMKRELQRTGTISLKDFYTRRAFRIFPAFYFYLAVIALLTAVHLLEISIAQFVVAGTYTWNYLSKFASPGADGWYLAHFWTLSIEEQFYLLWPLTLLWLRPRKAATLAVILICVTPFIRVASYFIMPGWRGELAILLHTQWDPLMMGSLVALWEGEKGFEERVRPLINNKWLLIAACVLALVITPLLNMRFGNVFGAAAQLTIEIFCIALVMLHVTRSPDTWVGRILNSPVVVFVGTLSYGLYLWQQLFLGHVDKPWKFPFPVNFLIVFACAVFSYFLVEKPFLRMRHTQMSPLKKQATSAVP